MESDYREQGALVLDRRRRPRPWHALVLLWGLLAGFSLEGLSLLAPIALLVLAAAVLRYGELRERYKWAPASHRLAMRGMWYLAQEAVFSFGAGFIPGRVIAAIVFGLEGA